jgi:hypothetical protein
VTGCTFLRTGKPSEQEAFCRGACRFTGVWMHAVLAKRLEEVPGLGQKLREGATVADIGCG